MGRVEWWCATAVIVAAACSGESTTRGDDSDAAGGEAGEPGGANAGTGGEATTTGGFSGTTSGAGGESGAGGSDAGGGDVGRTGGASGNGSAGAPAGEGGASGAGASGAGATGDGGDGAAGEAGGNGGRDCEGLECAIVECENGETTLTGRVLDPAGANPIHHALVYVPNAPLEAFPQGAECVQCSGLPSGDPVAITMADSTGQFTLGRVPSGRDIPLVVQNGKWRRRIVLPEVSPCVETPLGPELTRLPRNRSEGELPRIAVVTGAADSLECVVRRLGIDDSEFSTDTGTGSVHLYGGGETANPQEGAGATHFADGAAFSHASALWSDPAKLASYDALLHSCEGGQYAAEKAPYYDNIASYVNGGGRLLLTHLQFHWLTHIPDFATTADYIGVGDDLPEPSEALVASTTPKGLVFADWLAITGASQTKGTLELRQGQHSVASVAAPAEELLYVPNNPNDDDQRRAVQVLTFRAPVDTSLGPNCGGRVTFADLHTSVTYPDGTGHDNSDPSVPFPNGCDDGASPLSKALEFLLFDLTACSPADIDIQNAPTAARRTAAIRN